MNILNECQLTLCTELQLLVGCGCDSFSNGCFHRNDKCECSHLLFLATWWLGLTDWWHPHLHQVEHCFRQECNPFDSGWSWWRQDKRNLHPGSLLRQSSPRWIRCYKNNTRFTVRWTNPAGTSFHPNSNLSSSKFVGTFSPLVLAFSGETPILESVLETFSAGSSHLRIPKW